MYFFYYIPVGLDIRVTRRTAITYFMASSCVVVFLVSRYMLSGPWWNFMNLVFWPANPSLSTAVTHIFMHTSYLHLIGNIVYILIFGRAVEDRFGPLRFTLIFVLSAVAGAYTHMLFTALFSPPLHGLGVVGASGATSGLLGAFLVRFYFSRVRVAYWVFMPLQGVNRAGRTYAPVVCALLLWLLFQGTYAVIQLGTNGFGIAYLVHIGGFGTGVLLAVAFGARGAAGAERHLTKARLHFTGANWFASQGEYLNYLSVRPDDASATTEAARAFVCTRDMGPAREHYRKAIDLCMRSGARQDAEDIFKEAIRSIEGFALPPELHLDLAFMMERTLKFQSAVAAYRNYLSTYPRSQEAPFILLRIAGILEKRFRKPALSLSLLKRILGEYHDDVWADYTRSEVERLERAGWAASTGPA